jgi:hypothetical protein
MGNRKILLGLGVLGLVMTWGVSAAKADTLGSCRLHCFHNYRLGELDCQEEPNPGQCIQDRQREYDACMADCDKEDPAQPRSTDASDMERELAPPAAAPPATGAPAGH